MIKQDGVGKNYQVWKISWFGKKEQDVLARLSKIDHDPLFWPAFPLIAFK